MEKEILKKVTFCDFCGKEEHCYPCLVCGKDGCFECQKNHLRRYEHAVHFAGSDDGYFCNRCLEQPPQKIMPLLLAYQRVAALRAEYAGWWKDFDKRAKEAEEKVQQEKARIIE